MSRDCPECGNPLIGTADGGYACIQPDCDYGPVDADDAPPATGSPLDVRAVSGRVVVDVPDPRRGMDTRPHRVDSDAARRLAEALEVGADDADRTGDDDNPFGF